MNKFPIALCMMIFSALAASGASFTQCPAVGADTNGCELLITVTTVNGAGAATAFSVATASPDQGPFDGSEDTLIGITNSASTALKSIFLTGGAGSGAFSFDGDGACPFGSYTPGPSAAQCGTTNPTGYGSAGASFGTFGADSGTVLVGGTSGLATSASTWFDLEGQVTGTQLQGTPEPASLTLIGTGLGALYFLRRRRAS